MPPRGFPQKIQHAIIRHALLPTHGVVVVACSGGADSLALFFALHALCGKPTSAFPAITLHVAHLDHGLRDTAGAHDAAFVREICAASHTPCTLGLVTPAEQAEWQGSLEASARTARYRFLREVAQAVGADRIALGHTLDDQAETVLMHFIRGSGVDGLAGMAHRAGDLIRPLLGTRHTETLAYCRAMGHEPRVDATNDDLRFTRNRVRQELLPLLATYQAQIIPTLARNAEVIAQDVAYLQTMTEQAWADVVLKATDQEITLSRPKLRGLPPAMRQRVLRRAIVQVGSHKPDAHLNADSLDRLDRVVLDASGEPRIVQLSTGTHAHCDWASVIIRRPG